MEGGVLLLRPLVYFYSGVDRNSGTDSYFSFHDFMDLLRYGQRRFSSDSAIIQVDQRSVMH